MGRCIRNGVVEGYVLDLLGKHFDGLFEIPDYAVLSTTGFVLPGGELLPQAHHFVTHLLDDILLLLSVRGKDGLRHGILDLPLDQRGGVGREGPCDLRRNFRSQKDTFDLGGDTLWEEKIVNACSPPKPRGILPV